MKVKSVKLNGFKRFSNLVVKGIPEEAKLIVLVGSNGSGKTSFFEAFNHFYQWCGYGNYGESEYLEKVSCSECVDQNGWYLRARGKVEIEFYDANFSVNKTNESARTSFYFRTAYRNESEFKLNAMSRQSSPVETIRLPKLIENDQTVSSNYQRLVANAVDNVFYEENSEKTVKDLREELIGKIKLAIKNIFPDLRFTSLGNPLDNGTFHFSKGVVGDFLYKNLSAGEKAAFDLILDVVVQSQLYNNAVYCIDEPEIHMHTKLQGRVLRELYHLIPGESQLWIATHSIGMLREAEEIEKQNRGSVVFLNFGDRDFDQAQVVQPEKIAKALQQKFYELAFGDFAKLLLPEILVICEGDAFGRQRKDYDKTIYETIFCGNYPDVLFVSGGSCEDIINLNEKNGGIVKMLLDNKCTRVIRVVDGDDRSPTEVDDLRKAGIVVLSRRNLESYILDDEILRSLCRIKNQEDKIDQCLEIKKNALEALNKSRCPSDDCKKASGQIYLGLKGLLDMKQCGNSADAFIRDTLAPLVTPDTRVYKELEKEIFSACQNDHTLGANYKFQCP